MLRPGGLTSRTITRACVVAAALLAVSASLAASSATASRSMQVGLFDDGSILGNPDATFPILKQLRTQVIRVSLDWGGLGPLSVARRKPENATDPADPAYRWTAYDYVVKKAAEEKIKVLFSVIGTPRWANGGQRWNRAPTSGSSLRAFMYAAATRYSGSFTPEGSDQPLPAVHLWLAWNEPNDPIFLAPQYRKVGKNKYVMQSARDYARICNAVVTGVHSTVLRGEKVACGATGPRGNDKPAGTRPSVSPLAFLRAMKHAGAKGFDAYAHHPYYGNPHEAPTTTPRTGVTLANIGKLITQVTKLYGPKRIWLTEYGYQTKPPDALFGVSWALQARYLSRAYSMARKNPRIDMMIWFLLRDEPRAQGHDGWQSGLMTRAGKRKPAYTTFRRLPH